MAFLLGVSLLMANTTTTETELLSRARSAFAEGVAARSQPAEARRHFQRAAQSLESLWKLGYRNPELALLLGNTHLLSGKTAQAILAYRRGLRLTPTHALLRQHLETARNRVAYTEPVYRRPSEDVAPPWWVWIPSWIRFGLLVACFVGASGLITYRLMYRQELPGWICASLLFAGVSLAIVQGVEIQQARQQAANPLVVIAEDGVLVRKGNGLSYPRSLDTPVNTGMEARLLYRRADWLQIELPGGVVGWVPARYTLVDEP